MSIYDPNVFTGKCEDCSDQCGVPGGFTKPKTTNKKESMQDTFLMQLKKQKTRVNIFLANGIKLEGTIEGFDQYVVLLRNTNVCMLYKNNIATIAPGGGFQMKRTPEEETETTATTKD